MSIRDVIDSKWFTRVLLGGLLGNLLMFNACGVIHLTPAEETILSNPMTAPGQSAAPASKLLYAMCSVLNRCQPQLAFDTCVSGVLAANGVGAKLGLNPGSFDPFSNVLDQEVAGVITAQAASTPQCITAVADLRCSDPKVLGAYNPQLPNAFSNVTALIPSAAGACNDMYSELQITPAVTRMVPSSSQTFNASGGSPPYSFSLVGGSGAISASGAYQAPSAYSIETVRVTDSVGRTSDETFMVGAYHAVLWTGASDTYWSTPGNWQGGTVPTNNDVAVFDSHCNPFCNVMINAPIDVGGMDLRSDFAGSISQTATATVTVEAYGFTQSHGSFIGGGNLVAFHNGSLIVTGGLFQAPAANMSFDGDRGITQFIEIKISNQTQFSANQGTITLGTNTSSDPSVTLDLGEAQLNNFTSQLGGNPNIINVAGSFSVSGALVLDNFDTFINTGTIFVEGNLSNLGPGTQHSGGSALIVLDGSNGQVLKGNSGNFFPSIELAGNAAETISLAGVIDVFGSWKYLSGTVDAGTSLVEFGQGTTGDQVEVLDAQPMAFHDVHLLNSGLGISLVSPLSMNGNLLIDMMPGSSTILSGNTLVVGGNLNISHLNSISHVDLSFVSSTQATYANSSGSFVDGNVSVNKPNGSLTLESNMTLGGLTQNMTLLQGSIFLNGHALRVGHELDISSDTMLDCAGGCGGIASCNTGPALACGVLVNQGVINHP